MPPPKNSLRPESNEALLGTIGPRGKSNRVGKEEIVGAAMLSALFTALTPGLVCAIAIRFFGSEGMKGGRMGGSVLALVFTVYVAVAFCGGTALSCPFLLFTRIKRPWHSGMIALAATVISWVFLYTGVTTRLSFFLNFHQNLVGVYEPVAAAVIVQFVLISILSFTYRAFHRER